MKEDFKKDHEDFFEVGNLKRELEGYKRNQQLLLQAKFSLESEYNQLSKRFLELQKYTQMLESSRTNSPKRATEEEQQDEVEDERDHHHHQQQEIQQQLLDELDMEVDSNPEDRRLQKQPMLHLAKINGKVSLSTGPLAASTNVLNSTLSSTSSTSSGGANTTGAGSGAPVCRHFLQGKCRYKGNCKFSHELEICPYCHEQLPTGKVSASAHLSRCWKTKHSDSVMLL